MKDSQDSHIDISCVFCSVEMIKEVSLESDLAILIRGLYSARNRKRSMNSLEYRSPQKQDPKLGLLKRVLKR